MLKHYKEYKKQKLKVFSVRIEQIQKNGCWKKKLIMPKEWNKFILNDTKSYQKNDNGLAIITGKPSNIIVIDIDNNEHWAKFLFLNECTKESDTHIKTSELYDVFKGWFVNNNPKKGIPTNREFTINLRNHKKIERTMNGNVIKNMELNYNG